MRHGHAIRVVLVAAACLLVAGGGAAVGKRERAAKTAVPSVPAIEGPGWQLTAYREGDRLVSILPGLRTESTFWGGAVSGFGGCSDFATTYELDGADIAVEPVDAPAGTCDEDAAEVQRVLLDHLVAATGWRADGAELTLVGDGGALLTFTSASVPDDLTVSPWTLARINDGSPLLQPAIDGSGVTAEFLPGGRVVGTNGCGGFLGSYEGTDADVAIRDLAARIGDCAPEVMSQAELVVEALGRAVESEVTPAGLTLLDGSGDRLVTWVPSSILAGTLWTPLTVLDAEGAQLAEPRDLQTSVLDFREDGDVGGRTPCRAWDAPLRRSGLAVTFEMEAADLAKGTCKADDIESALLDGYAAAASFTLRRDLLDLLGANGTPVVRLVRQVPLTGTQWELDGMLTTVKGRTKLRPPADRLRPTAFFSTDGGLDGTTGCNQYVASYEATGMGIQIDGASPAGRRCPQLTTQEETFLERLSQVDTFIAFDDRLQLLDGNRVLLSFRAAG